MRVSRFGPLLVTALAAIGLLLGAAGAIAAAAPPGVLLPLRFDSEVVRLFIEPDSVRIEGLYRFACAREAGAPLALFYPYPSDSLMGGARTLSLESRAPGEAWEPLRFEELPAGRGVRWWVPACRAETLDVHTEYRQARRATHAVYIVTTTRMWGRPLRRARFEIFLPVRIAGEPRFSYPFQPLAPRTPEGWAGYVYEATDFLPEREITVDWTRPAGD
jgi:hypothetical protein